MSAKNRVENDLKYMGIGRWRLKAALKESGLRPERLWSCRERHATDDVFSRQQAPVEPSAHSPQRSCCERQLRHADVSP
jgi:hypothetical protein